MYSIRQILTDDQLLALGCVVAESSQLESTLSWILESCLDQSYGDAAKVNLGRLGFNDKLALFKRVMEALPDDDNKEELSSLLDHMENLYIQRNTAVHGLWKPAGGDTLFNLVMVMSGRYQKGDAEAKNINRKGVEFVLDVTSLNTMAYELHFAGSDLFDVWKKIWVDPLSREDAANASP